MSATVLFCSVILCFSCLVIPSPWLCYSPGVPYCVVIRHCQLYLNPSLSCVLCQIVMCLFHSFQRFFCLTSRTSAFCLFCIPLPFILDSTFCSVMTCSFWTLLSFSISDFEFSCFVVWFGLPSGFESQQVTSFTGKPTLFLGFHSVSGLAAAAQKGQRREVKLAGRGWREGNLQHQGQQLSRLAYLPVQHHRQQCIGTLPIGLTHTRAVLAIRPQGNLSRGPVKRKQAGNLQQKGRVSVLYYIFLISWLPTRFWINKDFGIHPGLHLVPNLRRNT